MMPSPPAEPPTKDAPKKCWRKRAMVPTPLIMTPESYPSSHHSPPNAYPYHMPLYPYQYGQYSQPVVGQHPTQPVVMYPPPQWAVKPATSSGKRKSERGGQHDDAASPKRPKTRRRACDFCRIRKIRCDVVGASRPTLRCDALADSESIVCEGCKLSCRKCTFRLSTSETRCKSKKRAEDEHQHKDRASASAGKDVAVFATVPLRVVKSHDSRYQHTFEISESGNRIIVQHKSPAVNPRGGSLPGKDTYIDPDLIQQLVNAYFEYVAPLLPIITKKEFLASSPPSILLYSMCLVTAARREAPQGIFDSIRYIVNALIRADDVLSTTSVINVQSLLILCMTGDCHSQFASNAPSALWVRLGSVIRMAQDLGLHRAEAVLHDIELQRRLWGACVISDRWLSLTYRHPHMIDIHLTDSRLPSGGTVEDKYMDELIRLSAVPGRVLKTIYAPSGSTFTTDEMFEKLLADIKVWKANLPTNLRFQGESSSLTSGILHLLYSCMMFWQVFMRILYSCPSHLKFGLTVEQWDILVTLTGESIDWLDVNDSVYDAWLLIVYGAMTCALVQYHTWVMRRDEDAMVKLRKLRDRVRGWEVSLSSDHMNIRRKAAEVIALLYKMVLTGTGLLEGIPGGMFDWGQWDIFFATLNSTGMPVDATVVPEQPK
ncbi:fungal-specific transcription factor domain-containing protein [Armillaria fumosa]|nr:fungal-specific transcription factor domain-containing protein [Armillaria fumosa]